LALLFLFQAIAFVPNLMIDASDVQQRWHIFLNFIISPFDIACPFLFWLYVRALTMEGDVAPLPGKLWHVAPIVIATLCIAPVLTIPNDILTGAISRPSEILPKLNLIMWLILFADLIFLVMVTVYIALIFRRLRRYRKRLRDVFASTENHELTWVWLITVAAGVYIFMSLLYIVVEIFDLNATFVYEPSFAVLEELTILFLLWVIGIWGLRQQPSLSRAAIVETAQNPTDAQPAKYKHSALDGQMAKRIAQKIEAAMAVDLLFRDPNLSLWGLSKHIAVNSHYVSQTLNTEIGRSFFDYVNHWRIKNAKILLTTTDDTILSITYDVGFNSRSSFYKSFKRETGTTPQEIRSR
jgi:AraC-like DNA-binding protein